MFCLSGELEILEADASRRLIQRLQTLQDPVFQALHRARRLPAAPRIEISGPQGVQATFDWQAARDSVLDRMCTATFVNDVETY
jgi:hypothetical protein